MDISWNTSHDILEAGQEAPLIEIHYTVKAGAVVVLLARLIGGCGEPTASKKAR